jgi:flavin reductase (DIM6/NTAB) family NADH-FMN oxidoreductase RutF
MNTLHLKTDDLTAMARVYRANLINSISGYKPAMLIGTKNADGMLNLAIFSSIVHLGADPALIGFIQRPVGVSGDTFRNIMETKQYTINHVHKEIVEKSHYTSAKTETSEFDDGTRVC